MLWPWFFGTEKNTLGLYSSKTVLQGIWVSLKYGHFLWNPVLNSELSQFWRFLHHCMSIRAGIVNSTTSLSHWMSPFATAETHWLIIFTYIQKIQRKICALYLSLGLWLFYLLFWNVRTHHHMQYCQQFFSWYTIIIIKIIHLECNCNTQWHQTPDKILNCWLMKAQSKINAQPCWSSSEVLYDFSHTCTKSISLLKILKSFPGYRVFFVIFIFFLCDALLLW